MGRLTLAGLLPLFLAAFAVGPGEAQICKAPPTSGPTNTWTQGTNVTVYVDPNIPGWSSQDFRNTVRDAFGAWDHVGGADVSFTIVADGRRAHEPPANSIGLVPDNRNFMNPTVGPFNLRSAVIHIDDYSANPSAMRSPLAHEIGHTFGLENCTTCKAGQSVMGPGGLSAPTPCDRRAVKENGGYFGIDVGGGRGEHPENCQDCGVQNCTVTMLCRCPNRDCGVRDGRLLGDWQCTEMGRTCSGGRGCCRGDSGGVGSLSEPVCGGWDRAYECEWGSVCCLDPTVTPPLGPPTCESMGWYDDWQVSTCEEVSGTTCTALVLLGFSNFESEPLTRECWQPDSGSLPSRSCGALGGDYCSQSGACPSGYSPLAGSSDCSPCCKANPPAATPTPMPAGPSCGEMGGDYCSQSGRCPPTHDSLGRSSDCNPCCVTKPSCGAMGGDYCSQSGWCPDGYENVGRSSDCDPCCKSQ